MNNNMSKEEFLKIQTCVLQVNIHCDGCKQKVKKILQKIDGVYTIKIEAEQGKVTVSGNVDPATLIKKLSKSGKYAQLWGGSPKPPQINLQNMLKNLQIDHGKGGNIDKGGHQFPKGGAPLPPGVQHQLQQMKGIQDLKMMPLINKEHNPKSAKSNLSEDGEDMSDDEFDDDDDDDDDDDYDDDDDVKDSPSSNESKPVAGKGHGGSQMLSMLMKGKLPIKGGGNVKKVGEGGNIPVLPGIVGKGGPNGGKNGANGNDKGNGGGVQDNKNGILGETKSIPNNVIGMNMPIGQLGKHPIGQMANLSAVQGLPALSGGGRGGGYFNGVRPENPYYQQQLAAMMNQQRANGNDGFQPMMYARPPPAVNYMPPYPHYPYPPPPGEQLDHYSMFSDENTDSCTVT